MSWQPIARQALPTKQVLAADALHVWWWPDRLQPAAATRRQRTDLLLRTLLARYLPVDPGGLLFGREAKGRPFLRHDRAPDFNLSDTVGGTVLAVAARGRVGIDIERMDRTPPVARLAARWFAPDEATTLQGMEPESARRAFLHLWTAKEAACKATGTGIFGFLSAWRFEVESRGAPPLPLGFPKDESGKAAHWHFHRLAPEPSHTVALVCRDNPAIPLGFLVVD